MNRVSVVIPSRLRENPVSCQDALYLDGALESVWHQSVDDIEIEMLVGIDKDHPPIQERHIGPRVTFVEAGSSQAEAVNRAAEKATGNYLAICEDDDRWAGVKLEVQLAALTRGFDLATCNQREIAVDGQFMGRGHDKTDGPGYNNFPTPSGWLMKREVWEKLGGFDETFRYHVDTEWLGRANGADVRRIHLINEDPQDRRGWLPRVAKYSAIETVNGLREPLVNRIVTDDGGMAAIDADLKKLTAEWRSLPGADMPFVEWAALKDSPGGISMREHGRMAERYGGVPW